MEIVKYNWLAAKTILLKTNYIMPEAVKVEKQYLKAHSRGDHLVGCV